MKRRLQQNFSAEETEFIGAILQDPQDDVLRLVYADWLEEQGDSRCDYLRMECEFAEAARSMSSPPSKEQSKHLHQLRDRIKRCRKRLADGWLSLVSRSGIACCGSKINFDFECSMTWDQLTPTRRLHVRHCDACDSVVYFETSEKAALKRANKGDCVCLVSDRLADKKYQDAFDRSQQRSRLMGLIAYDPGED